MVFPQDGEAAWVISVHGAAIQKCCPEMVCRVAAKEYYIPMREVLSSEVVRLLEIDDLSVSIGGKQVLKDFNLRIGSGETHALFGPNGTGKTTLL
ncbi:MAG TPA: ATP-binding cassette domain-containing protein, partial [Methanothrix sp.]|nr:ATP-binding cassette domain-containing protein [Methanothrix sp.]